MRFLPILTVSFAASTAASCSGRDLNFGEPPIVDVLRPPMGGILDSASGLAPPGKLALAGDTIVFATPTQVMTIPALGGTPTVRSIGMGTVGLVADSRLAAWIDGAGVVRVLNLETDAVRVVSEFLGQPSGIALDETNIYWTAGGALYAVPRIAVMSPNGGPVPRTELASGLSRVGRVAAAAGSVVFVAFDDESPNGRLVRLPTSGDLPNTVAQGAFAVGALATDGSSAFWTVNRVDQLTMTPQGGVFRAALIGGQITSLSALQGPPGEIAVVGQHLYFHDTSLQRITITGESGAWMPLHVDSYAVNERMLVFVTSDPGGWALMVWNQLTTPIF